MGKEISIQVQEAQGIPYRIKSRRNTLRDILIKIMKIKYKEQILNTAKQKQQIIYPYSYHWIPIMLLVEFSRETLQARKEGCNVLKVMKGKKKLQRRLLYPARISFRFEGEIKSFTDKQKWREFSTTKSAYKKY